MRRTLSLGLVATLAVVALAGPASATVHEITGMFCAGEHGNHFPPGISGQAAVENEARPLFATGFVQSIDENFEGDGVNGPGVLVSFDFDHPASKLSPLPGVVFFFGDGLYVTGFELDSSHGFTNCVVLR